MKKRLKSIDTQTRHVTKAGANIFLDLGFEKELAEEYFEQSLKQINEMRAVRSSANVVGDRVVNDVIID